MPAPRPHLVIFVPDQWRGDVMGHMGNTAAVTPNLDRLAAEDGVSFRHTYCQNPVCTPSRCSFMTGWYPHVRGHRSLLHMLRPDDPCLLKLLKDSGYHVWWGGKNDLVPAQHGYGRCCDVKYMPTTEDVRRWGHTDRREYWPWFQARGEIGSDTYYSFFVGKMDKGDDAILLDRDWSMVLGAIDHIGQAASWASDKRPMCIYLPLSFPHCPYQVEEPYFSAIDRRKLPPRLKPPENWRSKPSVLKGIHEKQNLHGWTEDRWIELRATYYGMCARVDAQFGMVVDALKQAGLYDDTAVFFFSDHGDFAGDYGLVEKTSNTFEDCLTRVPFVIKPPVWTPCQPGVRDALVELIDFPATVEHLAGIEPGHDHFGRSLVPLIRGDTLEHRDAVFCEGGRLADERHCAAGRANPTDGDSDKPDRAMHYWPRLSTERDPVAHTKATMCRTREFKYVQRLYESDELYDLRTDPAELHNVIDEPRYARDLKRLRDRLLTFYQGTCDVVPRDMDQR